MKKIPHFIKKGKWENYVAPCKITEHLDGNKVKVEFFDIVNKTTTTTDISRSDIFYKEESNE